MNIIAIIQARTGSTRLPNKVMRQIKGKPLIGYTIDRVLMVKGISSVVVAIPQCDAGSMLAGYIETRRDVMLYIGGAENDLVDRFLGVLALTGAEAFIRICGDSPLIDPKVIQPGVDLLEQAGPNSDCFYSNAGLKALPPGQSVEGCTTQAYCVVAAGCEEEDREHAGFPYLYRRVQTKGTLVDRPDDFEKVKTLIEAMPGDHRLYGWRECASLLG